MDEVVFYVTAGDPADKHAQESLAAVSLAQRSHHYASFRNAECPLHAAALSGVGPGERLFVASPNKALVTTYAWGKESADQRMPVPEPMACLAVAPQPTTAHGDTKPAFRVPWLLAAGSASGKLYVWELSSGTLLCVKDAHYQLVSVLAFSPCGTFLFLGGLDSRVNVWRVVDLVSAAESSSAKPYALFADHSLAVTDLVVSAAAAKNDLAVCSASRDGTLRVYDVATKTLQTTFVFPHPVHCVARDPAGRALYAGLDDGSVRQVPLYVVNPYSHVLEAVGGSGKIVTVEQDPLLAQTFVHHVSEGMGHPTALAVSMDGMRLVLGDSNGQVFVADVVTKQIVKAFTPCKSAIAAVAVMVSSVDTLRADAGIDKKHRLLPQLKRVLALEDPAQHTVTVQIPGEPAAAVDFPLWLQQKAQEELDFKVHGALLGTPDAEAKLQKVSAAYTALKTQYEELHREHFKE